MCAKIKIKERIKTKKVEVLGAIGLNLDEYSYSKPSLEKIRFIFKEVSINKNE